MKLFLILQNLHQILLHPKVNFAVAVEGAGTFSVAGEGGNKVRILDLPIDVAGEGTTGKVAAGDLAQRMLDLLARDRVQLRYQTGDAGHFEGGLDVVIVVLLADEGQQLVAGAVFVFLNDFEGNGVKGDYHRPAAEMQRLGGDVFQGTVLNGLFSGGHQVAHPAAHIALEHKNVPLLFQYLGRHWRSVEGFHLVQRHNDGSAVFFLGHLKVREGPILGISVLDAPGKEGLYKLEKAVEIVLAALTEPTLLRKSFHNLRVFLYVQILVLDVVPEVVEGINRHVMDVEDISAHPGHGNADIDLIPVNQALQDMVMAHARIGQFAAV